MSRPWFFRVSEAERPRAASFGAATSSAASLFRSSAATEPQAAAGTEK